MTALRHNQPGESLGVPRPRWKIPLFIPQEEMWLAQLLVPMAKAQWDEDALVALWGVLEPHAVTLARKLLAGTWSRLGNRLAVDDLVSLGKVLFLKRLVPRWDPAKGTFLRYALVTFHLEFRKCLQKELRWERRTSSAELDEVAEPEPLTPPLSQDLPPTIPVLHLERALARLRSRQPELTETLGHYLRGTHPTLREAARANGGPGRSRSSIHRALVTVRHWMQEEREKTQKEMT